VAGISLTGAVYLALFPATERVVVAAVDLPKYHQIEESDLRSVELPTRSLPDGVVRDRDAVLGTYTLTRVHQDQPLDAGALGPELARDAFQNGVVVGIDANALSTAAGALAAGDKADTVLAPTTPGDASVIISGVVVLNVSEDGVVALVPRAQGSVLGERLGTSRAVLVRTEEYSRP
jgi:flagella basal body P-ring formation protein FlgA